MKMTAETPALISKEEMHADRRRAPSQAYEMELNWKVASHVEMDPGILTGM